MEKAFETEVLERLARIEQAQLGKAEVCELHRGELRALNAVVHGNGKPGLITDITNLRLDMDTFKAKAFTVASLAAFLVTLAVDLVRGFFSGR